MKDPKTDPAPGNNPSNTVPAAKRALEQFLKIVANLTTAVVTLAASADFNADGRKRRRTPATVVVKCQDAAEAQALRARLEGLAGGTVIDGRELRITLAPAPTPAPGSDPTTATFTAEVFETA